MNARGLAQRFASLWTTVLLAHCAQRVAPPPPIGARLVVHGDTSCALDERDTLWCWGMVHDGATYEVRPPTLVGQLAAVAQLVTASGAVCARTTDGAVHCAGANERGQLGAGAADRGSLARVESIADTVELVVSAQRFCARTQDGALWCWGASRARSADGSTVLRTWAPTRVTLAAPITRVHGGVALCVEFASGAPQCEQGLAAAGSITAPWVEQSVDGALVRVSDRTCALRERTLRCGEREFTALPADFTALSLLDDTLCGTTEGTLRCRGPRVAVTFPTMGAPDAEGWQTAALPRFAQLSASARGGCVVSEDRRVSCWGDNHRGALARGLPPLQHEVAEIYMAWQPRYLSGRYLVDYPAVIRLDSVVWDLALDERLHATRGLAREHLGVYMRDFEPSVRGLAVGSSGACVYGERTRCRIGTDAVIAPFGDSRGETQLVASGDDGFARIATDGAVYWARADGSPTRRMPFSDARSVIVARGYLCAVDRNDILSCVGDDYPGTLGDPPTRAPEVIATDIATLVHLPNLSCAIDRAGAVSCWGADARWLWEPDVHGAVNRPRPLALPVRAKHLSAADDTLCVLAQDGTVQCRGNNESGQAGQPPSRRPSPWTTVVGVRDAVSLRSSSQQSCAFVESLEVARCWGMVLGGDDRYGRIVRQRQAVEVSLPQRFER